MMVPLGSIEVTSKPKQWHFTGMPLQYDIVLPTPQWPTGMPLQYDIVPTPQWPTGMPLQYDIVPTPQWPTEAIDVLENTTQ
jgi:hypothetical protein